MIVICNISGSHTIVYNDGLSLAKCQTSRFLYYFRTFRDRLADIAFVWEKIDNFLFFLKRIVAFPSRHFQLNTKNEYPEWQYVFSSISSAFETDTPTLYGCAIPFTNFCRSQFPRGFCVRKTETEKEMVADKRGCPPRWFYSLPAHGSWLWPGRW